MRRNYFLTAFCIIFSANLCADDISNPDVAVSVYSDHKALNPGDQVTILINESVSGTQKASLKTSKTNSINGGMGSGTGTGSTYTGPSWGMAGNEAQDGGGTSQRSGSLTGSVSAGVVKVLSNGSLVIKGTKVIQVNDDKQVLVIEGVIRPEDIGSGNTIDSGKIADAKITFEGSGPVGEKTSPGIITRILDWLGIF